MRRSVVRIFGAVILFIAISMLLNLAHSYAYVMHGLTEGFEIDGVYELRSGRHGDDTGLTAWLALSTATNESDPGYIGIWSLTEDEGGKRAAGVGGEIREGPAPNHYVLRNTAAQTGYAIIEITHRLPDGQGELLLWERESGSVQNYRLVNS